MDQLLCFPRSIGSLACSRQSLYPAISARHFIAQDSEEAAAVFFGLRIRVLPATGSIAAAMQPIWRALEDHCTGYETEYRTGHPGYPAVQLCLTIHQWGLRFVPALFKQEGHHFPIILPTGNTYHEISIFKSFCGYLVILSLYPHFLIP